MDKMGHGTIDGEDYKELRKIFGKCEGDFGFNAIADYDENGCVSYRDYRIWYYEYYMD